MTPIVVEPVLVIASIIPTYGKSVLSPSIMLSGEVDAVPGASLIALRVSDELALKLIATVFVANTGCEMITVAFPAP